MSTLRKVVWLHISQRRLLCVRTRGLEIFYNVGGKLDHGESDRDALIREVKRRGVS